MQVTHGNSLGQHGVEGNTRDGAETHFADTPANVAYAPQETQRGIYRSIFHSTAALGSVRILTIFVSFARDKALATVLGPAGIGIIGMCQILVATTVQTFSLGINVSGVREISYSTARGNANAHVWAHTLRRLNIILGAIGSLLVAAFYRPISRLTFGHSGYEISVLILSLPIFFIMLQSGYYAELQGRNRIPTLARATAVAAVADGIILVLLATLWGLAGIAPGIAISGAFTAFVFWRVTAGGGAVQFGSTSIEFLRRAKVLIVLGISLAGALFLSNYVAYAVRTLITHNISLEAAGLYVSAFSLSGKSIGFLLDSMRADLYPRLSAVADDNGQLNRLVNGQTEICLLITSPAILLMIGLAPWLVRLCYSGDFAPAAKLVAWFSLGSLSRVIATPLGYVRLAKGRSMLYFVTEVAFAGLQIGVAVAFIAWLGLTGAVIGFTLAATLQLLGLALIAHRLTGFRWSHECVRLFAPTVSLTAVIFVFCQLGPPLWSGTFSLVAALVLACYNVHELVERLGPEHQIARAILRVPGFNRLVASIR